MKSSRDTELRGIFNSYLHIGVDVVEIVVYILVILAIFHTIMSVVLTVFKNETNKYQKIKILINNTISICLSGIVFVEVLMKLFYIKTYKQLGIIARNNNNKNGFVIFCFSRTKTRNKRNKLF